MKKLILSGFLALSALIGFSQTPTKIGTSTNYVEVRHLLQIDGMAQSSTGHGLAIDASHHVIDVDLSNGSSYVLPVATTSVLGGIKPDGTSLITNGTTGVTSIVNPTYTIAGDATGSGNGTITITLGGGVVINSKLANMPANTLKGNNTGSSGVPLDLSILQIKTMLSLDQVANLSPANLGISTAVANAIASLAPLNNPTFTGTVNVPTAAPGTNNSTVASTAFVIANSGGGSGYVLPIASNSTLGGIKIGTGFSIAGDGTLSALANLTSFNGRTGTIIPASNDYSYAQLSGKPTTLALAGITDAYPLSGNPSGFLVSVPAQTWASLLGKPTTASAAGLTDPFVFSNQTYTDPAFISTINWTKVINKPTTINGFNISDAVSLTGVQTLTNKTLTSPLGIVKADIGGINNVDNTSDATKNAAAVTLTNKTISGVSNTFSNIPESAVTNLTTDLGNKANVANQTFTGNFVAPRTGNATLQTDTLSLLTFGGGSGQTGDTLWVSTSSVYGSLFLSGTNKFVITSINFAVIGSASLNVDVKYGATLNSGGTELITGGTNVTSSTTTSSISNPLIATGNYIWLVTPTVTTKPVYLQVTLIGYKIRN